MKTDEEIIQDIQDIIYREGAGHESTVSYNDIIQLKDYIKFNASQFKSPEANKSAEEITVRKFMLKKFPTNKYIDCPVPRDYWDIIQEYANEFASSRDNKGVSEMPTTFAEWTQKNDYSFTEIMGWVKNGEYNSKHFTTEDLYKIFLSSEK